MSCFSQTAAIALISSSVYTAPVGLQGVLKINILVLGVTACSNWAAVILKPDSLVVVTNTGTPPQHFTTSG